MLICKHTIRCPLLLHLRSLRPPPDPPSPPPIFSLLYHSHLWMVHFHAVVISSMLRGKLMKLLELY